MNDEGAQGLLEDNLESYSMGLGSGGMNQTELNWAFKLMSVVLRSAYGVVPVVTNIHYQGQYDCRTVPE